MSPQSPNTLKIPRLEAIPSVHSGSLTESSHNHMQHPPNTSLVPTCDNDWEGLSILFRSLLAILPFSGTVVTSRCTTESGSSLSCGAMATGLGNSCLNRFTSLSCCKLDRFFVYMYVCVHACMYIYMYIYVCIHMCVFMHTCLHHKPSTCWLLATALSDQLLEPEAMARARSGGFASCQNQCSFCSTTG